MKVRRSELEKIINEVLLEVLSEQKEGTPMSRKERNRAWGRRRTPSNSTDPNISDGRENIVKMIRPTYVSVQTRLQIIEKMSLNATQSATRQEFKEYLIQMFENLKSLQEKDLVELVTAYNKVTTLLGSAPTKPVVEQNLNPDSPEGRKNLVKDISKSVGEMRKIAEEGSKMLGIAETVSTVSVFKNEIKAVGQQIAKLRTYLTRLNSAFVTAFKEYEIQRGRSSVVPSARVSQTPPPIPAAARKNK